MNRPCAQFTGEEAEAADRERFPDDPPLPPAEPVAAGASGRRFYRIRTAIRTRILMAYPPEPHENQLFSRIGETLRRNGIAVPCVLAEDEQRGLVWLEDLGDRDLFSTSGDPRLRHQFYPSAIELLLAIQALSGEVFQAADTETLPPFDTELYHFEQRYFEKEFLGRIDSAPRLSDALRQEMEHLTALLDSRSQVWTHRDFQSKNLMIDPSGKIRVVDFQGIRRGHPFYDLASLLIDPYMNLPGGERLSLFARYCDGSSLDAESERPVFHAACCQRLMQALGAFGRFGIGGGVPFFRKKIPGALHLLCECAREAGMTGLSNLAKRIGEESVSFLSCEERFFV